MSVSRVFKKRFSGSCAPEHLSINEVMNRINDGVDLRPSYQRDICWTKSMMDDLIETVMEKGILPPIILYQFQPGDERPPNMQYECVDGQHRLFTLRAFFKGEPVKLPGKKAGFMVTLKHKQEDGNIIHLFYKRNPHTDEWASRQEGKLTGYFTEDERLSFMSYCLDLKTINGALTKADRIALFLSLSKGKPVTGCDKQKNYHDIPLLSLIAEQKWEGKMKAIIRTKCLVDTSKGFWLNWICRLYLLSQTPTAETYIIADSEITGYMERNHSKLASTEDTCTAFTIYMNKFITFMEQVKPKVGPALFHAIYVELLTANEDRAHVLLTNLQYMEDENGSKWNARTYRHGTEEERATDYTNMKAELAALSIPAVPLQKRKAASARDKSAVWRKDNGASLDGKCYCCKDALRREDCQFGHILSVRQGGKAVKDNLHAICYGCNNEMRHEHMYTFMDRKGYMRT